MKNFLSAAARLIFPAAVFLAAGCGWFSKEDAPQAAEKFFALMKENKTQEAYEGAAFAFQAQQTVQNFQETARGLGLAGYQSLTWTRKVLKEKEAKLDGEIRTREGRTVAIAATLIREHGRWRIYSLRTPGEGDVVPTENKFSLVGRGGAFSDVYKQNLPEEKEIRRLVRETLGQFNSAIQQHDFTPFYNYISVAWQSQISLKRMAGAFQGFIDHGINLGGIRDTEAVFNPPPQINTEGVLVVEGYFPTSPYTVTFSLRYTYELPKWKLYGLEVNVLKK